MSAAVSRSVFLVVVAVFVASAAASCIVYVGMTGKTYDLTALDNDDVSIGYDSDYTGHNATVYFRPCSPVSTPPCTAVGNQSVCFDYGNTVAGAAAVGQLLPTHWTRPPPDNATFNYFVWPTEEAICLESPRGVYQLSINMFCNPLAPVPYDREASYVNVFSPCQYNISIYTPLVCKEKSLSW